ncbi:MAG: DUF3090 domain-containing protein [Micrococcales bacterium]|nr:DUF3090 domain-containing protein [Micrococcales bacterium]
MPMIEFDPPERFVAGTVGPPGQRTFFLQAGARGRLVSVSLEKVQVEILADRVDALLEAVEAVPTDVPSDMAPLDTPIEDEFRVTTLALSWDDEQGRVVIEAHDHDPDEEPAGQSLRVVLDPAQAASFAARCRSLAAAGRPACPFCGGPLDPEGHICPRANGYRR